MARELPTRFDPAEVEARWQRRSEELGLFRAPERPAGPTFSMVLPPPNVTGTLTLGHMLGDTVMDLLVRWHRMRGEATLWVPGVDHAGLSTQVEVRRSLAKKGIRLETLPREEILREIGHWKEEREARIGTQIRAGGFSVDWTRYRYTMDPGQVAATREVFLALYRDGLVYRGERIVNWDPKLRTAVSDLEVVHREEPAELLHLTYRWSDGSPGGLVVATVRPETIFGDVAVAVHPDDARHREAVGRKVRVPLTDRDVPVITDEAIDPAFGTGALKVTPRHDRVDFEVHRRHPEIPLPATILDDEARLVGELVPPELRGLDRDAARAAVATALAEAGLLVRTEPYTHSVARSERSDAVIEPSLSTQWFVRLSALAPPVVEAVRSGAVRLHPERWNLTFFRWMDALEDWCISRQVVWGHPIPVFYCELCGAEAAGAEPPARCARCGAAHFRPDPDVLDTWFTSWLWPFAALGWPERTGDLAHYYPTGVLVTGRDIMFFWVARMLMAGFRFTGKAPFADVYFTGMLRDEQGRRMSKHLGNSPDPAELIRERGADALRVALMTPNPVDQDGPFGSSALDGGRNFLTKLWNVSRFALAQLPEGLSPPAFDAARSRGLALESRWILSRWHRMGRELDEALAAFEITRAVGLLVTFAWNELADRYIEVAKEALAGRLGEGRRREAQEVLAFVLERTLRQLHPIAPHVTEELWQALPHEGESLPIARWPQPSEAPSDPEAEATMERVLEAIRAFRNLRAEHQLPVAEHPSGSVRPATPADAASLLAESATICRLARLSALELLEGDRRPAGAQVKAVSSIGEFYLPASGSASSGALGRERLRLADLLERTRARLADDGFRARAPPHVVSEAEEKARELTERLRRIDESLAEGATGGRP